MVDGSLFVGVGVDGCGGGAVGNGEEERKREADQRFRRLAPGWRVGATTVLVLALNNASLLLAVRPVRPRASARATSCAAPLHFYSLFEVYICPPCISISVPVHL
jgi:hypothetical protein